MEIAAVVVVDWFFGGHGVMNRFEEVESKDFRH